MCGTLDLTCHKWRVSAQKNHYGHNLLDNVAKKVHETKVSERPSDEVVNFRTDSDEKFLEAC